MNDHLALMESAVDSEESSVPAPALLVELPSWGTQFRQNLSDLVRPQTQPALRLASKPAEFWPDVFVSSRLPWGKFAQSGGIHGIIFAMLWGGSLLWARRPQLTPAPVRTHEVIYYEASEYLPPLDTGGAEARQPQNGDPVYAPQPILSVPPEADNRTQTVVTPPNIKLSHDVPLPNVVSWPKTAVAVPIAATVRNTVNSMNMPVVAPPPDIQLAATRHQEALRSDVVAPAPEVDATNRRVGDLNIGPSAVVAPAPQLSMDAQRTAASARDRLENSAMAVPPPPSVGASGSASASNRLIALGIHPAAAEGPVVAPEGNRRGSFSATPQGKPGASGAPAIAGNRQAAPTGGGQSKGSGSGAGAGKPSDIPAGLTVGEGPDANRHSAIGGNGQGNGSGGIGHASASLSSQEPALLAKVTPPRVSSVPQRDATEVATNNAASEEEKKVFGDRKFYSLALNVPNLNSSGGSWVVHFAEMNPDADKTSITAPSAYAMADPAYPLELIKQHIQGNVTLYAIIRSDGSVSNVRVLRSIDDRLDQYASAALSRWRFHPATKNSSPIDVEAVVTIPFRPGRSRSSF